MNEEIIIDGVNIYECTYSTKGVDGCWYCEEHLYDDGTPVYKCKENKDCYFKQLKCLQTENEGLKSTNDFVVKQLERRVNQLREYRKALEEIKKLINETCWDYTDISIIPVKEKMLEVISEVLK